jgi:hypothetical protein
MKNITYLLFFLTTPLITNSQNIQFQHGTVILTVITPDSILMVADTRETVNDSVFYRVSKIIKTNDTYHAISGKITLRNLDNNKIVLNLRDTLEDIISKTDSFDSISDKFRNRLYNSLRQFHISLPLKSFKDIFPDSMFIQISVVKFINKKPTYIFGVYKFLNTDFNNPILIFIKDNTSPYTTFLNKNGKTIPISSFLRDNKHFLDIFSVKKLVYLTMVAAKNNSTEVGCPIQTVIIKPDLKSNIKTIYCEALQEYLQNLN